MKKALKITGIVLASIIIILLVLPLAFKGKVREIVIREGNKMLNAEFYFESMNISLLRNFPNATVTIRDFTLRGVDNFAADTLASARKVSATMNLASLFSDSGYDITKVELSGIGVKAVVLQDGRANWDIMKPSEPADETVKADGEGDGSPVRIRLKSLTIDNANIVYDDRQGGMLLSAGNLGLACRGDFSAQRTLLKMTTDIDALTFRYGGVAYISNAKLGAKMNIDADLEEMVFRFADNTVSLNAIDASLDGMFAMLDNGYDMDVKLETGKVGFKELLSMIPAVYAKDFQGLKASGDVSLAAWAKGKMAENTVPAFEVSIDVNNGSFRYPSLPQGVDGIRIAAVAKNPGGSPDLTTVSVNPLRFRMAGNDFSASANLATPLSDPAFGLEAKGAIDLGKIKEVYPLDDGTQLNGLLNADLSVKGRMSYVEKGLYDQITASGTLRVADMSLTVADVPEVRIDKSLFTFTPAYLQLSETTVNIGKSDLTADCRLENYLGFVLKGETVSGQLNLRSDLLDLNELTGNGATPEAENEGDPSDGESSMKAFRVPENIAFDMNTSLRKVLFDNLTLDNVSGKVAIKGGKVDMGGLSFGTLGGKVTANGYYSTAASSPEVIIPELKASFGMEGLSFAETFRAFSTVRKLAPIFENLKGTFSGSLNMDTSLDESLDPVMETLNATGRIATSDLSLSGVAVIDKIADAANYPKLKNITAKDLDVSFIVKDGRVNTTPFDIKMGDMNLNLSGSTGIDRSIDYTGKLSLPESAGALSQLTTLDLKIGGTFSSPTVSVDTRSMVDQAISSAKDNAIKEAGKALGVDLSDAESQRTAIIEQAQKAGDALVKEAQKQSDALIENADGAIAKATATVAGKKLVSEAKKQAEAIVKKATEEGDKLVEKAKNEQ